MAIALDKKQHIPALNLHIEPRDPIELPVMLNSLAALGRRYQKFVHDRSEVGNRAPARLYVSSISPGSIDISLVPDLVDLAKAGGAIIASNTLLDSAKAVTNFAESIKALLANFQKTGEKPSGEITVKDCDDAINIVKPIAESGGSQTFNVNNVAGDQIFVFHLSANQAKNINESAVLHKANLGLPDIGTKTNVALIWKSFERSEARTSGSRSPDKGVISEIDPKPKSILFGDDQTALKADIIADDQNLLKMVYYVDVEIIQVEDKIKAYRIINYHGKEPIDDDIGP